MNRITSPSRRQLAAALATVGLATSALVAVTGVPTPVAAQATGAVASSVVTVEPTRVLDTRFGTGLPGPIEANANNALQITGSIPTRVGASDTDATVVPDGATGVLLNVTALRPSADGFISIRPGDAIGDPSASNLNFAAGAIVPNAVTVALASDGSIDIWYGTGTAGATTGVLIDIVGFTTEATGGGTAGPAGPQGDAGPAGPAGPTGATGATGASGADGADGDDGADGADGADGTELYTRTIIVNGDGTAAQNGTALAAAVTTAGNATPTQANPWVVQLEPGTFDLGSSTLTLPNFVTLTGAGRTASKVVGTGDPMIEAGQASEISRLWIVMTNASGDGDAVEISHDDVRILDARVEGLGGTAEAIDANGGLNLLLSDVELIADGNGLEFSGGLTTLRSSTVVSNLATFNALGTSGDVVVESSHLEATGNDVIAYQGGGNHTVSIYNSVLIGFDQTSNSGQASDALEIFNSHVDVNNAFAFNGTATCALLSTPAPGAVPTGCV